MYCKNCGTDIGDSKFCPNCGANQEPQQAPQQQQQPLNVNPQPVQAVLPKKKKKSAARITIGVFLVVIGVCLFFSAFFNALFGESDPKNKPTSSSQQIISSNIENIEDSGKVNYENFEKIKSGMTYKQVVEIFGEEGKVLSSVEIGEKEYETIIYYWYDHTGIANCNVTFQGGVVKAKAQVGLR